MSSVLMPTKCHWKDCKKIFKWRLILQSSTSQADTHPESHGVREQCVESDIQALETPAALLLQQGYKAIIISGGPSGASQFTQRMPHYTSQQSLLAVFQCREFVMHAINQQCIRWNGGEKRYKIAEGLRCVAKCSRHIISAIADTERRLYGVKFHDLIENGRKMLHNFLFDICGLQGGFTSICKGFLR
ncbi:hypothetical protein OUZ56_000258 [Daphnia magna]|uniref:GMP synthase n=1 Tax=Daphnia magna TaxID=35525 RepID=A0ABQ9ZZT4_9CRUS|nr:hypothetical protein OUZ56_000258 [Daphnia magna]